MSREMKEIMRLIGQNAYHASAFCVRIQRSFTSKRPTEKEIEHYLKNNPLMRDPDKIADAIKVLRDSKKHQSKVSQSKVKKKYKKSALIGSFIDANTPDFSPSIAHDPRRFQENFTKCQHGIPKTQVCHICKGGRVDY